MSARRAPRARVPVLRCGLAGLALLVALATPASAAKRPWYYPLLVLSPRVYHHFQCIIWHESRSTFAHPNLGDNNPYGSSGIFQIEPVLWNRWAPLAEVSVPVWTASPVQQATVAAVIYRHDGWWPWADDGC